MIDTIFENELFNDLISITAEEAIEAKEKHNFDRFQCDLDLYIDTAERLMYELVDRENYEECHVLKKKIEFFSEILDEY